MAVPLITRQRVFAAKVETTNGTAISLAAADATVNVFDPTLTPQIENNRREGQSSLSQLPAVPGARSAQVGLRTELVGNGASGTAAWISTFLLSSGFVLSGSAYVPVTGAAAPVTLTCGLYQDGRRYLASGVAFDWTMEFTVGNPVNINWTGTGVWNAPTDVALLAPTYSTIVPPRFAGATLTIGGTAYRISTMTIAMNNEVVLVEDESNASGYIHAVIVNRDVTVTMDPEGALFATKDWYAAWLAGTEAALSCLVNGGSNNSFTFACPKLQPRDVQPADRNGLHVDQITFQANRSVAAGDDELTITPS